MKPETLTVEELEHIKTLCEAAPIVGINWPLALSLFPTENEQERRWKERMLTGIQRECPQALKS